MGTSVTSGKLNFDNMLASHLHSRMTGTHKQVTLMDLGSICRAPYTS